MTNTPTIWLTLATSLMASSQVMAHEGHDHSHWTSEPIHLITALAVAGVALVIGITLFRRHNKTQPEK
ncbi:hypothetical protein [Motilimonas pumila]|uniref:LPXTG cell wall anchor domain-containing protein n=1 Tax=Motilimonas pumila TaxID=2303987 RepID=A0A418YAJ1_9GAMM|nr:hypothetical protein [Motilimonas pumila]RJG39541.1 hypothetical protein D1Z90_18050 [Motilimonas pumila]